MSLQSTTIPGNSENSVFDNIESFVTPEKFGAVGDGVVDDSSAFTSACATGKNIICNSQGKYLLNSQVVFPIGKTKQIIDGNGCVIIWNGGNEQPFNQRGEGNALIGYTKYKSYQNMKIMGPVKTTSRFSSFSNCHAINFSDGYVRNIKFDGWTNCLRAFGNTMSTEIIADNVRNAIWSERNNNNHISNVKGGWIAGDVLVFYSQFSSAHNINVEYAGIIPENSEETGGPRSGWGCLVSTGQDGYADETKYINISDVICKYHGGGGIIIGGEFINVQGVINVGDAYQPSFANRQWAVWVSGTDNNIGDIHIGQTQGACLVQSGSTRCSIGRVFVSKPLVGIRPFILSAYDDAGAGTKIAECRIEGIFMEGHLTTDNAIVLSTDGLLIGEIFIRSNGNQGSLRTLLIRGGANVGVFRSYNISMSAGTANVVELQSKDDRHPIIGVTEVHGHFGVCIYITSGCIPLLGDIRLRMVRNGGLSPIVIENDGSGNFFFGNVTINGALGAPPKMNGTLSCAGFYSPAEWRKKDPALPGIVRYPDLIAHTLT
ncbi:hypothetical protein ACI2JR_02465 [Klebsiella sp. NPDC088457]